VGECHLNGAETMTAPAEDTYRPFLTFLSDEALERIHQTALRILSQIGVRIYSPNILRLLADREGVNIDLEQQVVTFAPDAVQSAIAQAPPGFTLYGRDDASSVTFSPTSRFVSQSIAGEYAWVDPVQKTRRDPTLADLAQCVTVADGLPNVDIVGAMVQPGEIPVAVRDIHIIAEMLKRTRKPVRTWIFNATSARYVMELFQVVAGGAEGLRARPRGLLGFEPTSPLMLSKDSLETLKTWVEAGQPVSIGPIVQPMGTGPVTLAGALAQQDAEILAGLVVAQALAPGVGVVYFGASLMLDPRTADSTFASPEQMLLMAGSGQLAHRHGLPAGMQMGLSDAKVPDAQAGMEKGTGLLMGALAGMNLTSGLGIAGCDQGASLPQLVVDDEIVGFVRAAMHGLAVNEETCAYEVIHRVGIGGNFLTDPHTLAHIRERWIPRLSDRHNWAGWQQGGSQTMFDRAVAEQERILREHELEWLDEASMRELDRIVAAAEREILGG
jgi:trimethylamine--corrinoid protein Co-methyltransferase